MADLSSEKRNIQVEETRFRFALTESLFQKVGKAINFINTRQYDTKAFFINGPYNGTGVNELAVDGLFVFPFDAEIFDIAMFNIAAGSGGTTELDVKRATASGGAFSTIFSTRPAIASTAGNNAFVRVGGSGTGLTAPVLSTSPFQVSAGHAIKVDFISKQTGSPENCGLLVYMRPR